MFFRGLSEAPVRADALQPLQPWIVSWKDLEPSGCGFFPCTTLEIGHKKRCPQLQTNAATVTAPTLVTTSGKDTLLHQNSSKNKDFNI